MDYYKKHLYR